MFPPTDAEILCRPLCFIKRETFAATVPVPVPVVRIQPRRVASLFVKSSLFFLKYGSVILATTYVCARHKLFPTVVLFGLTAGSILVPAGFVDLFVYFFAR